MHSIFRGLLFTTTIAIIASILGSIFPIVGSAIFALLIGMLINNIWNLPHTLHSGIRFSSKNILHYSIIVLGFTLSLKQIGNVGLQTLPILMITLTVCFITVIILLKWLNIDKHIGILIGVGTAICGGSAIAATSPVIKARDEVIALSLSIVFLFNLVAVIIFPALGHYFHMSQHAFGVFAGTAINDTSSVVAASALYGSEALESATIVKLTRTLFIIPITLGLAWWTYNKEENRNAARQSSMFQLIPYFIIGFLITSMISTIFHFPVEVMHFFKSISLFLITIALAGVGLSVRFKSFKTAGLKPIIFGLVTWCILIIISLIIILISHLSF
ncbi:YeiH family protein [Staphylococcus canis]|uniref:YeiH family putative sulfate export transporter n=1 Tax=Staphylococcus canis TaxID=2724942 RepID=A0ABS0T6L1_9STAP|nr:YeiH family protein [Staphylococcus canis]MBI5974386.1 YeiH family putative sulfate export transporter [Staphylococcus canis]